LCVFFSTDALVGVAAEVADDKIILSGNIEQVSALGAENKRADLEFEGTDRNEVLGVK
jgi:hypothetical protein